VSAPEEIRTERLVLHRLSAGDLDDLVAMHADRRMMKTLGGLQDETQTRAGLASNIAHWDEHGFGLYSVRNPSDGRFWGRCGLRHVHVDDADEVEIGWAIVADQWGNGYATEAARANLDLAFGTLGLHDIVSFTLPYNDPSRRVMEKLGFLYEKDCWHAELPHVLYRLRRDV
jgi:RimJ/RimL family protein N-acetyltransferase